MSSPSCQAAAARCSAPLRSCARAGSPASPALARAAPQRHNGTEKQCGQLAGRLACCDRRRVAAAAAAGATTTTAPPAAVDASGVWDSFAAAVSGEWEGVTASYGPDGEPQQLPEYYVPQAYRDWGVELYDWQSQSSMLAEGGGLTATSRRMMPTVGCEADAIAFTQEGAQLFGAGIPATVAPDGAYTAGPADISAGDLLKAACELCVALPPADGSTSGRAAGKEGQPLRLRVVHNLARRGAESRWGLDSVEIHLERHDSPYRGKLELSGCGGGLKGFATGERLAVEALEGQWEVAGGLRYTVDPASGACSCSAAPPGERWSAADAPGLLLHPLRAWSACATGGEGGGDVTLAAGALLDEGGSRMALASRRMAGGRLVGADLLELRRVAA